MVNIFLWQRHFLLCCAGFLTENKENLMACKDLLEIKPVYSLLLIEFIILLPHKIKFACMINRLNFDSTQFLSLHVSPWIDNVIDALPPGFKCPDCLSGMPDMFKFMLLALCNLWTCKICIKARTDRNAAAGFKLDVPENCSIICSSGSSNEKQSC